METREQPRCLCRSTPPPDWLGFTSRGAGVTKEGVKSKGQLNTSHPCKDRKDAAPRNSTSAKGPAPHLQNHSKRGPPAKPADTTRLGDIALDPIYEGKCVPFLKPEIFSGLWGFGAQPQLRNRTGTKSSRTKRLARGESCTQFVFAALASKNSEIVLFNLVYVVSSRRIRFE